MTKLVSRMYLRKEMFKENFIRNMHNTIEGYNGVPIWFIVALIFIASLAIITVVGASIFCTIKGYSYFGIDFKKGATGFIGVGCLK